MSKRQTKDRPPAQGAVVYCGPTIPGVAKQYTVYTGGLPAEMESRSRDTPAICGLVVPLDQLPEAMRQLREGTGRIYTLYRAVQGTI